jgi:hypothetical protein
MRAAAQQKAAVRAQADARDEFMPPPWRRWPRRLKRGLAAGASSLRDFGVID